MKKILIISLLFPTLAFSQIFQNPSLSTYHIKIYCKGKCLKDLLLKPFQSIKVNNSDGVVVMYYKRVDDICDEQNLKGKGICENAKGHYNTTKNKYGFYKSEPLKVSKKIYFSEWWEQNGFKEFPKGYHYLYQIYLLPLNFCPRA